MAAAGIAGLLVGKGARIGGRISPELVQSAKHRTGIESDTDLIAFALANIALDDPFPAAFKRSRGSIDADIELGY